MAKVYGIAAGTTGGYGAGDVFEATAWQDQTVFSAEKVQDLDGAWVEVLSVFVVDGDEVHQGGYDFLELVPRVQ